MLAILQLSFHQCKSMWESLWETRDVTKEESAKRGHSLQLHKEKRDSGGTPLLEFSGCKGDGGKSVHPDLQDSLTVALQ